MQLKFFLPHKSVNQNSGVAAGGARGQSDTPDSEKFSKNRERGKIKKKEEKSGRKGKN